MDPFLQSGFYDPYSAFNQREQQPEPAKAASTQAAAAPSQNGPQAPAQGQQAQPGAAQPGYYGGMPPYNPYWAQTNRSSFSSVFEANLSTSAHR